MRFLYAGKKSPKLTVRIGFVGSGGIANAHMRSLAQIEDAEMVAFCDVVPERAQTAASTYGGVDC